MLNLKLSYRMSSENIRHPFAGFPAGHLEKYLRILVQEHGRTVVIVEEYPEEGKMGGILSRRVGRVVTPGTLVSEAWASAGEDRYLLSIAIADNEYREQYKRTARDGDDGGLRLSLAYTDPATGEFFSKDSTLSQIEDDLARISPREVVLDASLRDMWQSHINNAANALHQGPVHELLALLQVLGVYASFTDPRQPPYIEGISSPPATPSTMNLSPGQSAINLLRYHLLYALRDNTPNLPSQPDRQSASMYMQIDAATLQALEIRHAIRPGGLVATGEPTRAHSSSPLSVRGTLLSVLNRTQSTSGHRLLVRTLTAPSTDIDFINKRLELVQAMKDYNDLRIELRAMIKELGDVMRIIMRFRGRRGDLRDVWETGRWVKKVELVRQRIRNEINHVMKRKRIKKTDSLPEGLRRLTDFIEAFESPGQIVENIDTAIDERAMMSGMTTLPGQAPSVEDQEQAEMLEGIALEEEAEVQRGRSENGKGMTKDERREETETQRIAKEDSFWVISPE
jgi:DNA mismatch repair ATPase MutS